MSNYTLFSKNSPEVKAYYNMRTRCYNKNFIRYYRYGGRGIVVCKEWMENINTFLAYVGKRPSKDHSLDRINNNGNYEPGNVQWATRLQQQANTSQIKYYPGIVKLKRAKKPSGFVYGIRIKVNGSSKYFGYFDNLQEAIDRKILLDRHRIV